MKTLLIFITFFILESANAGPISSGGGNTVALEFLQSAQTVLQIYGPVLKTYPQLKGKDLRQTLDKSQILVSSVPLYVDKSHIKQECTAINFDQPLTIVINEKRWKRISQAAIKEALALHELLSLLKIEATGNYSISKYYLNKNGVTCAEGLCEESDKANPKNDEAYCRIRNNWFPSFDTFKNRFLCVDKTSEFEIWCDLWKDPVEFNGNKLDILGGTFQKRDALGGILAFSDIDAGFMRCTYKNQ